MKNMNINFHGLSHNIIFFERVLDNNSSNVEKPIKDIKAFSLFMPFQDRTTDHYFNKG